MSWELGLRLRLRPRRASAPEGEPSGSERVRSSKSIRNQRGIFIFLWILFLMMPVFSMGQTIKQEGWAVPDLRGLTPYSITIKEVDGVQKIVEKFHTPNGGQVARISGNGRIFAYAVDKDEDPPIDYLLLDPDGSGKFTQRLGPENFYAIPDWISD
jgi:hypothetical protein